MGGGGGGVQSIVEIENSVELLSIFQMFYYFNRRIPVINDLLQVQYGETPEQSEETSMKTSYEFLRIQNLTDLFLFKFYQPLTFF